MNASNNDYRVIFQGLVRLRLWYSYPVVITTWIHYLLSWTSRAFYFPDSRYLLEVLRDFLGRERERERGRSLGDPPGP